MRDIEIRPVAAGDFAAVSAGLESLGKRVSGAEAEERAMQWAERRGGVVYALLSGGSIAGTVGISPSRHMEGAASVGSAIWGDVQASDVYRLAFDEARRAGFGRATCSLARGDEGERAVWRALGATFPAGDAAHPVVEL